MPPKEVRLNVRITRETERQLEAICEHFGWNREKAISMMVDATINRVSVRIDAKAGAQ